jgi:hypothetical protein
MWLERHQRPAFVAVAIFVALSVLSDPEGKGAPDVPSVLALVRFAAAVESARAAARARRPALPEPPHFGLSMIPVSARGEHGTVYAGLLVLYAIAAASEKIAAESPARELFVATAGALLGGVCDEILAAGRGLAESGRGTDGRLAFIAQYRAEAERGALSERTINATRSALDDAEGRGEAAGGEAHAKEYAAARAALGVAVQSVAVIAEVG